MDYLKLGPSILIAPASAGYLAFDVAQERLHELNPLASLLAELCDGTRSLEAIRELVLPIVGDEGWPACNDWIRTSLANGLLESGQSVVPMSLTDPEQIGRLIQELRRTDRDRAAFVCQFRVTELTPEVADSWFTLGDIAQDAGMRNEARSAYERYLELHPDNPEIEHILIALRDEEPPPRGSDRFIEYLFDRFAESYDEDHVRGPGVPGARPSFTGAVATAGSATAADLNVLDLGCGTGLSGEPLRAQARTLRGVDLSGQMVAKARDRAIYDALHVAEITAFLAEPEGAPYDLIVSCDTVIYFGDLRQLILPSAPLLTNDGLLAFSTEKGDTYPFRLTDSGRYAHHADHVTEVAAEAGLTLVSLTEETLRFEYGEPVIGLIAVMQHQHAGEVSQEA